MNAREALEAAVRACREIGYDHDRLRQLDFLASLGVLGLVEDEWEVPQEVDASHLALCRGFVAHALRDAWQRCDEPRPAFRMLVGPTTQAGPNGQPRWHAMLEMKTADGARTWADVQAQKIRPPEAFMYFTPRRAFEWGPKGFARKIEIEEVAA